MLAPIKINLTKLVDIRSVQWAHGFGPVYMFVGGVETDIPESSLEFFFELEQTEGRLRLRTDVMEAARAADVDVCDLVLSLPHIDHTWSRLFGIIYDEIGVPHGGDYTDMILCVESWSWYLLAT